MSVKSLTRYMRKNVSPARRVQIWKSLPEGKKNYLEFFLVLNAMGFGSWLIWYQQEMNNT